MFHFHTSHVTAALLLLSTAAMPQIGYAASYLDTFQKDVKTRYTTSLAEIAHEESGMTTRTLDWSQPSVDLYFDLPPSERTSEIVLTLSADPLTRVVPNAPLQVQFNNGKPVPVYSNGRGFEARLPLDAAGSKGMSNKIRITYPTPPGADCITPAHGAWSIDLAESTLRMSGRAKSRNMSLSELSDYLEQPALSPKTVGLIARGPQGTDMQALAAQAISLRTPNVPKFSVLDSGTDFNVVMVKRSRLFDITNDPMILNSKGARIFVPRGRPTELIFTADTDAEIVKMLEIFATRELPETRRSISSAGELDLQSRLDRGMRTVEGKTRLLDLSAKSAAGLSGAQTYKFNVDDPSVTGGDLLLRLSTTKNLAKDSRLRVVLNGKTLGAAKLDKKRKSVAFDIQPGELNATANVLTLTPDFQAQKGFTCPIFDNINPGYSIGFGSRLNLNKEVTASVTELSQLTSSGGLFGKTESYIILPRQTREYQASLRVLGRIAKSKGYGLTTADYTRKPEPAVDKHTLIIGPSDMVKGHLMGAPKAFRDAMTGRPSNGENLLQASYARSASLGFDDGLLKYAETKSAPRKIRHGGVAALYAGKNGKLTGVISTSPRSSFVRASNSLIQPDHWNALKGGVVRWTSSSVVMTQTAQSDAGISKPKTKLKPNFKIPEMGVYAIDNLDLYWGELNWPEFDIPQVKIPTLNWPNFDSFKNILPTVQKVPQSDGSLPDIKTAELKRVSPADKIVKTIKIIPRLKPNIVNEPTLRSSKTVGLRGPFEFTVPQSNSFGSFQDIRREIKTKWSSAKGWVKTKTQDLSNIQVIKDFANGTDRLQDRLKPSGQALSNTIKDKLPGKGLVQFGDREMSVFGLILIFAFGFVLLLMSLASPASRLGGRH